MHHLSFVTPLNPINSSNKRLIDFINQVNEDIREINQLIQIYNETQSDDGSIEVLKNILRHKQFIENKYSDKHVSICPEFSTEIHTKLFSKIKAEFAKYNISSLYGIFDSSPPSQNEFQKF